MTQFRRVTHLPLASGMLLLITATVAFGQSFPLDISHALGTATIPSRPERVVVLGAGDAQIASALGANIVGAVRNSSSDDGNWYGIPHPLPADAVVLSSTEPNLEQIAAFEPDLILATTAQPTYAAVYPQLATIAPTVMYKTAPLQDSGEDLTTVIGAALGEEKAAADLIAASDAAISAFRADHPELEGKRVLFGQFEGGTAYLIARQQSLVGHFFGDLGMSIPAEVQALYSDDGGRVASVGMITPSAERMGILDSADVAMISFYGDSAQADFSAIPAVERSSLRKAGMLHSIGLDIAAPLLTHNPATTTYLLAKLEPLLAPLTK